MNIDDIQFDIINDKVITELDDEPAEAFMNEAIKVASADLLNQILVMGIEDCCFIPKEIICSLAEISVEKQFMILRNMQKCLSIQVCKRELTAKDYELNKRFISVYIFNAYKYESIKSNRDKVEHYLKRGYQIRFDIQVARSLKIITSIRDAIGQTKITRLHLLSVKNGLSRPQLAIWFPNHNPTRWYDMMAYCHIYTTTGRIPFLKTNDFESFLQEYENNLELGYSEILSKNLAYEEVIKEQKLPHMISSYELVFQKTFA